MGDTSLGQLAFVTESVAGVTPATPAFNLLDFVSEDITASGSQLRSNTVNPARVVQSSRRTSLEVTGGPSCEMTKSAATDALWEALLGNAFSSNVAKLGGSTLPNLSFERKLSATDYRRYVGCRVNLLELTIQPEQFVTAKWGLLGRSMLTANSEIAGSTYAAEGTNEKLTGLDTGTITLSNGMTGTFDYASLALSISNNMTNTKRVGNSPVRGAVAGLATCTGKWEIYIEDKTWADAFVGETSFDASLPLLNAAKGYTLNMQNVKITSYDDSNKGNGSSFIATIDFETTLDAAYASSFGVTKAD